MNARATPDGREARLRGRFLSFGALLAVVFWGVSFVATRVALQSFNPFGLVAVRFAGGAVLLVGALSIQRRPLWPRREDLAGCVLLGVLLGGHILIQSFGLLYTSAINTGWIVAFMPVTIAIGAHVFLGQRLAAGGWLGAVVALGGVFAVTWSAPPAFEEARFGDMLQLSTCLTWTAYTLIAAGPVARNGALRVTAFGMMVASLMAGVVAVRRGFTVGPVTPEAALATVFLGLFCSGVAYALWNRALHTDGASQVGAMLYFEPLVTVAAATVVLAEPVTGNAAVGGAIVLVGVWLMGRAAQNARPREEETLSEVASAPFGPADRE